MFRRYGNQMMEMMDAQVNGIFRQPAVMVMYTGLRKKYASLEENMARQIYERRTNNPWKHTMGEAAIDAEMKQSGDDFVYLDIRHRAKDDILSHFPNIYAKCLSIGIDMTHDMIPVTPAAHYMCGGILVDEDGRSSIHRLYACGECTSTGLHGANRLASNSLLEAPVFAHRIFEHAINVFKDNIIPDNIPEWDETDTKLSNEDILVTHNLRETQKVMSDYVGIVRSDFRLERALRRLGLLHEETESFYKKTTLSVKLCELRNVIQNAYIVIKSAMMRKESRGLHYTTDYKPHAQEPHDTVF